MQHVQRRVICIESVGVLSVVTSTQHVRGLTHIQRQHFIKSINSHLKNGKVCVKEITESFYRKYLTERDC